MNQRDGVTGERRVVTALFCDLVGSTTMAEEMDPEDWSNIVSRSVAIMSEAVARYDGTVTQFSGDSILAIFGAPVAHEDDPYRAVRAALDIITEIKTSEVQVRVGINTGLMVISDMEAGAFSGLAAVGDATNVAARIQSLAPEGSVLIGAATAKLVASDFDLRDMGSSAVKGKSRPVHIYEVVGSRGSATRSRGISGLRSDLVGRDDELAILRSLAETAALGHCRFAAVTGEPGIGKSRLLRELGNAVQELEEAHWSVGRCLSYGAGLAYHLVTSLVRALAHVPESDGAGAAGRLVEALAIDLLGAEHEAVPRLLQLVGARKGAPDEVSSYLHVHYVDAVSELITALCQRHRPLVLVCEDVHWADPSSVDLLDAMFSRCEGLPVLVVLASRRDRDTAGWKLVTSLRQRLGDAWTELALTSLPEAHTRQLVANLLEIDSLPETLRLKVLAKADGNPLFVEEVVRMLIDRGMVTNRSGRWVADPGVESLEVPTTVRGLLAARIDLLPVDVRRAAMVAAVIGRRFQVPLFEHVHPNLEAPGSVHPHLSRLEAQGFVFLAGVRPHLEFSFRHALVHDVMYETLLKRERKELHQQVGEAMEAMNAERADELAPLLAGHFDRSGDVERARRYLLLAGASALGRHAVREAQAFFDRARQLLKGDEPEIKRMRVEATIGAAAAGFTFIPAAQQIEILDPASKDAEALGDPNLIAKVNLQQVRIRHVMGQNAFHPEYQESLQSAFAVHEQVSDPGLRALLTGLKGQICRATDQLDAALPLFDEAVTGLEHAGRLSEAAQHCCYAIDVAAVLGRFQESEAWLARGADLAERSGDPNAKMDVKILAGRLAQERGQLHKAGEHLNLGIKLADEIGNNFCSMVGNFFAADQQMRLGDVAAAIPYLERTRELAAYCNAGPLELMGRAWLAAAKATLGERADEDLDLSLQQARTAGSGFVEGQILVHRATGRALRESPDWEAIFADFERALECFEAVGTRPYTARTLDSFGSALELAGQHERAQDVIRRGAALFKELGMVTAEPASAAAH